MLPVLPWLNISRIWFSNHEKERCTKAPPDKVYQLCRFQNIEFEWNTIIDGIKLSKWSKLAQMLSPNALYILLYMQYAQYPISAHYICSVFVFTLYAHNIYDHYICSLYNIIYMLIKYIHYIYYAHYICYVHYITLCSLYTVSQLNWYHFCFGNKSVNFKNN